MPQTVTNLDNLDADVAIAALNRLQTAIREDGFDVAKAPDGLWYWADEQDREIVKHGEHFTELHAWRDLALAREHVAQEAGLDPSAVLAPYFHFIYSPSEAEKNNGQGFWHRRAGWTTCEQATLYTIEQAQLFDMSCFATDAVLIGYVDRVALAIPPSDDLGQVEVASAPGM